MRRATASALGYVTENAARVVFGHRKFKVKNYAAWAAALKELGVAETALPGAQFGWNGGWFFQGADVLVMVANAPDAAAKGAQDLGSVSVHVPDEAAGYRALDVLGKAGKLGGTMTRVGM